MSFFKQKGKCAELTLQSKW